MKLKQFLSSLFALITLLSLAGCGGSGGAGLNGAITLSQPTTDGAMVTATATYTNPDSSKNLIGTPITFYAVYDNTSHALGTVNTNSSGTVTVGFNVPAFNGTKNVMVVAQTGELQDFKSVTMTGRTLTLTPPPNVSLTAVADSADTLDFIIAGIPNFVTYTDPFPDETLNGHVLKITYTLSSSTGSVADTLDLTADTTTTGFSGTALFSGATGKIAIPDVAGTEVLTINWTVTEVDTGLTASGTSTVTLEATAPVVAP